MKPGLHIACEVGGQPPGKDGKETLTFDVQERDAPKLADGGGVCLLRDKNCYCSLPLRRDKIVEIVVCLNYHYHIANMCFSQRYDT